MKFRDTYLLMDTEKFHNTEANTDCLEINRNHFEVDFVERYLDAEGIVHFKTMFNHNDLAESDLWEVFTSKDGANPLELLLGPNH